MKYILKFTISIILLFFSVNAYSQKIDLTEKELYIKKGFSEEWINSIPADNSWTKIPPGEKGNRKVRISELNIKNVSTRSLFSPKQYPPETFTFVTSFMLKDKPNLQKDAPGLFLGQVGMNWEIYLNGHLVKKEIHLSPEGKIEIAKNQRDVLVYLNPNYFKKELNILAFRIIGDPTYNETGFYWNGPYVVDDYEKLSNFKSEKISLMLLCVYLFLGIYHLFLYSKRTQERYNLYFALFSILASIYILSRSHTIYSIIPDSTIITRIELISLYFIMPVWGRFFDLILYNKIKRFIVYYTIFSTILIVPTIFAPLPFLIDVLRIWQATTLIPLVYYLFFSIGHSLIKNIQDLKTGDETRSLLSRTGHALAKSVAGNLLIGTAILMLCIIFDILDGVYFSTGITSGKYGFFAFITGITFIMANKFQNVHSQVEILNIELQHNIEDLNEANKKITISEEKYRFIVEGNNDIIFSMDENWNVITANKALHTHLKIRPESIRSKSFISLLHEDEGRDGKSISLQYIHEIFENFSTTREPARFKAEFKSSINNEPIEMMVRLEYLNIEGKNEILGTASAQTEDSLLKYFDSENQKFRIGNYLTTAEEITHRLTRNIGKFTDPGEINLIRIALREIIINSIEHGNLCITFEEKTEEMIKDNYFAFISKRQHDPKYIDKKVTIDYILDHEKVTYRIADDGDGFDYKNILNQSADKANTEMLAHGRGLIMAKNIFDIMEFNEKGNEVLLVKHLTKL